ncbi:uncharacterized protein LOC131952326 [Physella acuta]|uniref:uncharacterized protein LOC131952326 n=1 Tax=Physella acuta TaxID=109671 RepID=UPI0027DE4999|nr:uncharacterized protein LOC131952326 [Physella acuta]
MMKSIYLLLLVWSGHVNGDFTCTLPTPAPNAPAIPPIMKASNSYEARVEVNLLDRNVSMVMDEYLDYQNNRGALFVYRNGQRIQEIYSFSTDEIFRVNLDDKTCLVKNLSTDASTAIFGPVKAGTERIHIFGSAAALNFAADSNDVYVGTKKIRGVDADIWTTCLSSPEFKGPMKATYYFSTQGWVVSARQQQMLLRIEVEGLSLRPSFASVGTTLPPASARYFHHIYDFINYIPRVDPDPSVFQTPPEVVCTNRTSTRPLPTFPRTFRYRAEIVDPTSSVITHYAIWYNEDAKLVREDRRVVDPDPQLNTKNAVTEIHDFSIGVRHVIKQDGGCSNYPIDLNAPDSKEDIARFRYNHSIIVDIRDPNSFFRFNDQYKFSGQQTVRGVLCDVFSAVVQNFPVEGSLVNATFEYYFLTTTWQDYPLDGAETSDLNYPVQLTVTAPTVGYIRIYNFFDFAQSFIMADTFDLTPCAKSESRIRFMLTFPGDYNPMAMDEWKQVVYFKLVEVMNVSPLRLSRVFVESDGSNVYVTSWLLGTQNDAQFQVSDTTTYEHVDDKVIFNVSTSQDCADLCVFNGDFTCNAFEYCMNNNFACRLLKDKLPSTPQIANPTICVLNTRPVPGQPIQELTVAAAFAVLEKAVMGKQMVVNVHNANSDMNLYTAINVEVISGQAPGTKPTPSLPLQFSYRTEMVIPQLTRVTETFVWYDGVSDIVRYDTRDATSDTPYMNTYIHDFQNGVSYQIDQVRKTCDMSPIGPGVFDVVTGQPSKDGSQVVSMKSPQSLFYLNNRYKYIGQKSVRGIKCDVYEASRTDFSLAVYNMSTQYSVFKYYFQSVSSAFYKSGNPCGSKKNFYSTQDGWDYVVPDGTDITNRKPVMLEIEDSSTNSFFTVNFFDFDDQYHPASYFDTSLCYAPDQKHTFILIFKNQQYHPVLDQVSNSFINQSVNLLAQQTRTSPLQFQQVSLTYDADSVYLQVTALGNVPPFSLFEPAAKTFLNTSTDAIYASTPQDCAASCVSISSFICNSFDWCGDPQYPSCKLGEKHSESEGDIITTNPNAACTHYSRSENGTFPSVDVTTMYKTITDYVYDNFFKITVTLPDKSTKTYIATDIRDDLLIPRDPDTVEGSFLRKFAIYTNTAYNSDMVNVTQSMVSVSDCAGLCLQENTFDCASFDYSFLTGQCRLSSLYPDQAVINKVPKYNYTANVNIYSKLYTIDYTVYPSEVFTTVADKILANVQSDELCARQCTSSTDFRCESFEYCEDGSCKLRKSHMIQAKPQDVTNSSGCTHYSRAYLYDYVQRNYKTFGDQSGAVVQAKSTSECANLCSTGQGLLACASFTVCGVDRGAETCTLSTLDPTVNKSIAVVDSEHCSLFTRANPLPLIIPIVTGGTATATSPQPTTSTSTRPTQRSAAQVATNSNPFIPPPSGNQGTSVACVGASTGSSSVDIGARIGIAFGTLFLGLIVGGLASFLFYRFKFTKDEIEAPHMLRSLKT